MLMLFKASFYIVYSVISVNPIGISLILGFLSAYFVILYGERTYSYVSFSMNVLKSLSVIQFCFLLPIYLSMNEFEKFETYFLSTRI